MDAGGWKSAKLFLETYVHSKEAGRSLAEKFDKQSGKIGTIVTQPAERKKVSLWERKADFAIGTLPW